jgi:ribokinase
MKPIVVIGSSNTDFIMKMEQLPRKGETVTNAIFFQTYGGKGANQAVAAAQAGGNTFFINCVGDDRYGALIIENLKRKGVHTEYMIQERGIASGSALVMIDANGNNYLSVAPGANYRLSPQHLDSCRTLIEQAGMVVLQYEVLPETLYAAIDFACSIEKPILLNFAPARPIDGSYFQKIDLLVVNEIEAEFICGFSLDNMENVRKSLPSLLSKGPKTVIVTLGSKGAVAANSEDIFEIPAYDVNVVDTTAAGDVFCGALAVALTKGKGLQESVSYANAAAALSVTSLGAQDSIPSHQQVEVFIRERGRTSHTSV